MKAPGTNSAEPRRCSWLHQPPGRRRTSVPRHFRAWCRALPFVRASGVIGTRGLGAPLGVGPPWRARVSGCGAGARRAGAGQTPVPGAPLPPRPRGPDQTPARARSKTTLLLSCQFSRLSAELLVSDRKQRGGREGSVARVGGGGRGSRGAPGAGDAGGTGVRGLRVGPPRPAPAPPRLIPLSPSHFLPPLPSVLLSPPKPAAATRFASAVLFKKKKRIRIGPRCFLLELEHSFYPRHWSESLPASRSCLRGAPGPGAPGAPSPL